MPRSSQRIPTLEPIARCVVSADDQHRLTLPRDFTELVPWLGRPPTSIDCLAQQNGRGGLVLHPPDKPPWVMKVPQMLEGVVVESHTALDDWSDALRFGASVWPISLHVDSVGRSVRCRLQPSEGLRRLDLAPSHGEAALVFFCGELLELWVGKRWVLYEEGLANRGVELVQLVEDHLGDIAI